MMKFEFVTSKIESSAPDSQRVIFVKKADLPLHCPTTTDSTWNMHPRVYIPLEQSQKGEALCPYCGTLYKLNQNG
jgi:uncharacterized Zn-finger protein